MGRRKKFLKCIITAVLTLGFKSADTGGDKHWSPRQVTEINGGPLPSCEEATVLWSLFPVFKEHIPPLIAVSRL